MSPASIGILVAVTATVAISLMGVILISRRVARREKARLQAEIDGAATVVAAAAAVAAEVVGRPCESCTVVQDAAGAASLDAPAVASGVIAMEGDLESAVQPGSDTGRPVDGPDCGGATKEFYEPKPLSEEHNMCGTSVAPTPLSDSSHPVHTNANACCVYTQSAPTSLQDAPTAAAPTVRPPSCGDPGVRCNVQADAVSSLSAIGFHSHRRIPEVSLGDPQVPDTGACPG